MVIYSKSGTLTADVYVDENHLLNYQGNKFRNHKKQYVQIGDNSDSQSVGSLYDWIIWTAEGSLSSR